MAEKEAFRRYDSIRAFFGFRGINKFVFRKPNIKASAGFTLIELLLVIAILSIMAVVLITLLNPLTQFQKANDAKRKEELSGFQKTLEAYYSDNGKYPPHTTSGTLYRLYPGSVMYDWGSTWTAYNTTLPKDPSSSRNYVYYSPSGGQSYRLYANLERGSSDSQVCTPLDANLECPGISGNITSKSCGTSPTKSCNYGVTSSNISP